MTKHTPLLIYPRTLDEAAAMIFENLDQAGLLLFKKTDKVELLTNRYIKDVILPDIKVKFGLHGWNEALLEDCGQVQMSGKKPKHDLPLIDADSAAELILGRVWEMVNNPELRTP